MPLSSSTEYFVTIVKRRRFSEASKVTVDGHASQIVWYIHFLLHSRSHCVEEESCTANEVGSEGAHRCFEPATMDYGPLRFNKLIV